MALIYGGVLAGEHLRVVDCGTLSAVVDMAADSCDRPRRSLIVVKVHQISSRNEVWVLKSPGRVA
jgi:hypothetical protein